MALALVGGSFLSAFLQVLFDRMATPEFLNLFRKRENDDRLLKKLKMNLLAIEAVLDDAENKQTRNPAIRRWLNELHDAVNEAEDLLDKINTEALRLKVETEYQSSTNQVRANTCSCIPCLINEPKKLKPNNKFLGEIMPKIKEMVETLEACIGQIGDLGLKRVETMTRQPYREPSTSLVDETSVFGRDADIEKIIPMLLSEDSKGDSITVVPIVGLGGIGKTTLAQMVYNDKRVKDHFFFRAWVSVSEAYDATRITKELLRKLDISFSDSDESLDSLQVKLQVGLTDKRFLLVLDDVWNRAYNRWDNLRILFKGGSRGSKIIVTTRDLNVARMMGKEESIHHLNLLSREDCWSLFEKHAFENREGNRIPELEEIGKKILRKCGQLPLAVKTVAGLLRSKTMAEEWENVLRSEEWSQTTDILPVLKLSYIHLPSHLKRCFACCAVFHKDYQFDKEEIIQLWQANDLLLYPGDNERMANWGEQCIRELRMRSLFQQSTDGLLSMHDLVNDLARFVSREYCLRLEDHQEGHGTISRIRHFSYHHSPFDTYHKFRVLSEARHLKTLLPINVYKYGFAYSSLSSKFLHDMLPSFKSLRSLSLSCYTINELPDPIIGLKQLRFLNLSYTWIKHLPKWICTFYNLQTLLLSGCSHIQELPTDLRKLINLFYLDISGIPLLKKMPKEMGRLSKLQVLTAFVVGKESCSQIEELGKFPMLRGKLFLSGLENIPSSTDASTANMKSKENLESLTLEWKGETSDSQGARGVLDALQPHSNIKHLEINGYCGTRFPDWIGNCPFFCNLKSLRLSRCKYCFCLPPLGQLRNLQSLEIVRMSNISALTEDLYGDKSAIEPPFSSLKKFKIESMPELKKWYIPAECEVFYSLEELCIIDCPKLAGELPKRLLSRGRLEISGCNKLVFLNAQQLSSSLYELKIWDEENLKELCELKKLASLEKLEIRRNYFVPGSPLPFPVSFLPASLKSLSFRNSKLEGESWQCETLETLELVGCHCDWEFLWGWLASFPMLKSLSVVCCTSIKMILSIPHPRQTTSSRLTSLQSLSIWDCYDVVSFPEGGLPAPNLTEITLGNCEKLKSLPERMESLLPSLRRLRIYKCPEIECFPDGGLPFSLQSLNISDCKKLVSRRREWGLHRLPSLRFLSICDSHLDVEKDLLPCTLEALSIGSHSRGWGSNRNLKMLNNLGHLTSLKELQISGCLLLKSLPEERLPASLTDLHIRHCPLLKPRLKLEKGQDWPKVARIPCVTVDWELVP